MQINKMVASKRRGEELCKWNRSFLFPLVLVALHTTWKAALEGWETVRVGCSMRDFSLRRKSCNLPKEKQQYVLFMQWHIQTQLLRPQSRESHISISINFLWIRCLYPPSPLNEHGSWRTPPLNAFEQLIRYTSLWNTEILHPVR